MYRGKTAGSYDRVFNAIMNYNHPGRLPAEPAKAAAPKKKADAE